MYLDYLYILLYEGNTLQGDLPRDWNEITSQLINYLSELSITL